jgi:aryl sulfotransferase
MEFPQRTRVYVNHHVDSTRWDYFERRPDDIVIASSYKAGTTLTQAIVANMLFLGSEFPAPMSTMSPWLEHRTQRLEHVLNLLKSQRHRRFIKTHLPLDGLPYDERIKYVFIGRDARDVFMSLWNHYSNYSEMAFFNLNLTAGGRQEDFFPRPPSSIHEFWASWMTRGSFEGETDGWPFGSHLYTAQSWWNHRHLPNVLLLHYSQVITDVEQEARRIADFLGTEVPEQEWSRIVQAVHIDEMRKRSDRYVPNADVAFVGGAETFLYKGTNGRWREVLSAEELQLYDAACERVLTADCRRWLES